MGEVYRARDPRIGRDVAIKVLPANFAEDSERLRRFELEASTAGSLNHPNVLVIFDIGTHDGMPYLVSELLEGETLREKVRSGPLSVRRAIDYAQQVAKGLAAAHEKGIVHRDLKPENIFVTHENHVKILDFGLAKLIRPEKGEMKTNAPTTPFATEAGTVMGTVGYMAPEQVRGEPADQRSDIFALGAVLYEMLTGKRAFAAATAVETMNAILNSDPPAILQQSGAVPPSLERVVSHCLEKNPSQRFHSARDLAFALEALSGTGSGSALTTNNANIRAVSLKSVLPWTIAALAVIAAIAMNLKSPQTAPPETRVIRTMVGAGIDLPLSSKMGGWLSPDGLRMAYISPKALWVRSLDSLEPQKIADLNIPNPVSVGIFWSPDSKSIGYFNDGRLLRIAASGGQPQTICNAPSGRGGTWNANGEIVFTPDSVGSLYRVKADGGTPQQLTKLASDEQSHRYPAFLPDGEHVIFVLQKNNTMNPALYITSLKDGSKTLLVDNSSQAYYSDPGYLVFARDGILVAQAFDLKTLRVSGEAMPLASERISNLKLAGRASFSISGNGLLVYQFMKPPDEQMQWFDRTGKQTGTVQLSGFNYGPRVSPDGKRIAFIRCGVDYFDSDLWTLDLARGQASRLTAHPADYWEPVWSPDGNQIAFSTDFLGGVKPYTMNVNGEGEPKLVYDFQSPAYVDSWSKDGVLSIQTQERQTAADLWLFPLKDRTVRPFLKTAFWESESRQSPDNRWVAYVSRETGTLEVFIRSRNEGGAKYQVSSGGGQDPRWSRDGSELCYLDGNRVMAASIENGVPGSPRQLFETKNDLDGYDVSPDGRFLMNVILKEYPQITVLVQNWTAALKK